MNGQDHTSPRVALYARCARADAAQPLDAQLTGLRHHADAHGLAVAAMLAESGTWSISDAMLALLVRHDIVVVEQLSRLTRDSGKISEILELLTASETQAVVALHAARDAGAIHYADGTRALEAMAR